MKIAFDLDGTLDHGSVLGVFQRLSSEKNTADSVFVLTGEISKTPNRTGRYIQMAKLLGEYTGETYHHNIVLCTGSNLDDVARQKGEFCRNMAIDLFIDDRPEFIAKVRELSPDTVCLQVIAE